MWWLLILLLVVLISQKAIEGFGRIGGHTGYGQYNGHGKYGYGGYSPGYSSDVYIEDSVNQNPFYMDYPGRLYRGNKLPV